MREIDKKVNGKVILFNYMNLKMFKLNIEN